MTVLPALLFSCNEKKEIAPLYNVDSLVSVQVSYLTSKHAGLRKEARIGPQYDDSTYTPKDTLAWSNELEIFRQLEVINKPINRNGYIIDDGLFDPASNLTVKAISALEKQPVRYLRIFYLNSIHKPRKIEALYNDGNALYESGRLLSMEFNQVGDKNILTSYSIQGGQKMILGDSVSFLIKGKIIIE